MNRWTSSTPLDGLAIQPQKTATKNGYKKRLQKTATKNGYKERLQKNGYKKRLQKTATKNGYKKNGYKKTATKNGYKKLDNGNRLEVLQSRDMYLYLQQNIS